MPDHSKKWRSCLDLIQERITPEQFSTWFKPLSFRSFEDGVLNINAPSQYFAEQIEMRFLSVLSQAIVTYFGQKVKLIYNFKLGDDSSTNVKLEMPNSSPAVAAPEVAVATETDPGFESLLNRNYTFENYCGSDSNKLPLSLAESVARNPHRQTFNPMFLFGSTGVGKTHLIQAIGLRILEENPKARVRYVPARRFESEYTTAVASGKTNDFFNFYQSVDVLIIDDVQDLAGKKPATQNCFFHIFNQLHLNQRQLILSCDTPPTKLEGLEERLISRFKWGITVELAKPDLALRKEVLRLKARQDGLDLPVEILDFIADNVTDSIRELEGVVASLLAHSMVLNRDISIDLARNVLSNAVKMSRKQLNFDFIADTVSDYFDVDPDQVFSSSRQRSLVEARNTIMYLAKKLTKMPYASIGARFSRTHATVLHACNTFKEHLTVDKKLRRAVDEIEARLRV